MTGCGVSVVTEPKAIDALLAKAGNAFHSFYPPAKAGGNSTLRIKAVHSFIQLKPEAIH
jgi:hypothetical protein